MPGERTLLPSPLCERFAPVQLPVQPGLLIVALRGPEATKTSAKPSKGLPDSVGAPKQEC